MTLHAGSEIGTDYSWRLPRGPHVATDRSKNQLAFYHRRRAPQIQEALTPHLRLTNY